MTLEFTKEFLIQPKTGGDTPTPPTPTEGLLLSMGQPCLMGNPLENEVEGYVSQAYYIFNDAEDSVTTQKLNVTPVGSISITDDFKVSGFTGSNYVTIPSIPYRSASTFEMVLNFTLTSTGGIDTLIGGTVDSTAVMGFVLRLASGTRLLCWGTYNKNYWDVGAFDTGIDLAVGNNYVKMTYDGEKYTFYWSSDGETWTTGNSLTTSTQFAEFTNVTVLGGTGNTSYVLTNGTLNLNNCYINLDNQRWWDGVKTTVYSSDYTYPDFISAMEETYDNSTNYPVFSGANGTQVKGKLTADGIFTGEQGAYILLPEVLPLQTADTWEFQTKYTHKTTSGSTPNVIGYSGTTDCQFPALSTAGNRFCLFISSTGSGWDIASGVSSNVIPTDGVTYYFKVGFSGTEYYLDYNTNGSDNYTRAITITNSTKCYAGVPPVLMNNGGGNYNSYYCDGDMDLTKTKFIINGDVYYEAASYYTFKKNSDGLVFYDLLTQNYLDDYYEKFGDYDFWGVDKTNKRLFTPIKNTDSNIYYMIGDNYKASTTIIY